MVQLTLHYKEGIQKGLRPLPGNSRNTQFLVQSKGIFPEDDILRPAGVPPLLDLPDLNCSFPYPQVIPLAIKTLVCTPDAIYEWDPVNGLALQIQDLQPGLPWTCADFQTYLVLTNGLQTIVRTADTGKYAVTYNPEIPVGSCITDHLGRAVWGAPNLTSIDLGLLSAAQLERYIFFRKLHDTLNNTLPLVYTW